jgi:hypothetical protein
MRLRWVLRLALVALLVYPFAWWFAWQTVFPPPLTCDLPQRPELCELTRDARWEGLDGRRPVDIRVHGAPARWANLGYHPQFVDADWGATLGRYLDPEWYAACHLEPDGRATCYAVQDEELGRGILDY